MAANKSVRFLPVNTPFAGVRGTTHRGTCVPPAATASATRVTATSASDFVLPGTTNPFPFFPFPKDPCVGQGGGRPPAPPGGESKKVIPLTEKTAGEWVLA